MGRMAVRWMAALALIALASCARADRDCAALEGKTPEETAQLQEQCRGWQFRGVAQTVAAAEPFLIADTRFADFQKWTLANQRYIQGHIDALSRIYVVPPAAVQQDQLAKTFAEFAAKYTELEPQIPEHLALHRSMFTDAAYDVQYMRQFDQTVHELSDGQGGYHPLDCDYMAQPLDAMWFSLQSARLLDRYATTLWGSAWEARRDQLLKSQGLKTPDQVQPFIDAGFPYVPSPQFAKGATTALLGVGAAH